MKFSALLKEIQKIAEENDLSQPYVVGGLLRDKVMGIPKEIKDIDLTTGNADVLALSTMASIEWPSATFRLFDDGHSSLQFDNIQIDWSNNFNINNIENILKEMGIENPTDIQKEVYSRDFTINTLLLPTDMSGIQDLTGKGLEDCTNRVLRTPIAPEITIQSDPKRILRALRLQLKLNLTIEPELNRVLQENAELLKDVSDQYAKTQINKMLEIDAEKALILLDRYDIFNNVALSKKMIKSLVDNKMVQFVLDKEL